MQADNHIDNNIIAETLQMRSTGLKLCDTCQKTTIV